MRYCQLYQGTFNSRGPSGNASISEGAFPKGQRLRCDTIASHAVPRSLRMEMVMPMIKIYNHH